jgi:hypothetical protein
MPIFWLSSQRLLAVLHIFLRFRLLPEEGSDPRLLLLLTRTFVGTSVHDDVAVNYQ